MRPRVNFRKQANNMIDQVTNKGYAEISAPATVSSSGAGNNVLTLLYAPNPAAVSANTPTLSGPQGRVAFILDTTVSTGSGSMITTIQSAPDNSTWTNVVDASGNVIQFTSITNAANSAGLQMKAIDAAYLGAFNRAYDTVTGTASAIRSVVAVFIPKNP
jgi:hypothetical protein